MSSHDPRVVLGIGAGSVVHRLEVRWPLPSDHVDIFVNVQADRYYKLTEGKPLEVVESSRLTA